MIEGHGMDSLAFRFRLGRVFVLAVALLLLVSNGWANCVEVSFKSSLSETNYYAEYNSGFNSSEEQEKCNLGEDGACKEGECPDTYEYGGGYYTGVELASPTCYREAYSKLHCGKYYFYASSRACIYTLRCDTECEAEEQACISQGGRWVPSEEEGECGYCDNDTTDVCAEFRAKCQSAGGDFSGSEYNTSTGKCCTASCNLCNNESAEKIRNQKTKECCAQNLAPPSSLQQCYLPLPVQCFMVSSIYSDEDNDWACRDPNQSTEAYNAFYRECGNSSSSNEEGSSSSECEGEGCEGPPGSSSSNEGPESSSSDDDVGPNSSGDASGCEECQLIEEAIDTLHLIHLSIDAIYNCLSSPYLCTSGKVDESNDPFQFDTAFRRYLRPLMDSMLKVDSNQLKALVRLDTNTLKMLRNDTTTRTVIEGGFSSLEDTTRKWFKRIADSIGVSTSELASHIDSIIRHIPDSVLDSIVKYQQYATDNFDSVLYGHGKGFSLVDSLIDSAVRYFQLSNHYDSMYNLMFRDSLGTINQSVDRVPIATAGAVNSVFGYGDTASSTLRGDLEGIRGAIEGLGDTSGLGDALGGGGNGSGSGADTSGYGSYVSTMSGRYSNLARNAAGGAWGDSATLETVFASDSSDSTDVDSASERDNGFLLDSAHAMLKRGRDSLLRDTSLLAAYYDTLKTEMQFFNFDSLLIQPLREALPAVTSCPEDCFKGDLESGTIPHVNTQISVNYNLCRKWPVFGDADIFMIFRVLLRIITAITCIYIGAWYIADRKI